MSSRAPSLYCPFCRDDAPKPSAGRWRDWEWRDCPACGAGFAVPFRSPGPSFYEGFEELYPRRAQETTDPMSREYDEALAFLKAALPRGARLLDVGCGAGGFLSRALREGFRVSGVDFDGERLRLVRERLGLDDLLQGSVLDYARARPGESFAAATMFQVLEHLDRPVEWLEAVRGLLEPGGLLVVGVPNRARTFDHFRGPGMEEVDNPPNHLSRWTAAPLAAFVSARGFTEVSVRDLPMPLPLLALSLRNRLRLGLATRALGVAQVQHLGRGSSPAPAGAGLVLALVRLKEAAVWVLAAALYPAYRLAGAALGWQGPVLLLTARRTGGRQPAV